MKRQFLTVFLAVAMVFAMTAPAMADSTPVPTPQGGLSSFVASTPVYEDGKATFAVTVTYGGGNATIGTLSWSGDVGELTYAPLTTNTTGSPRRTTGEFTVEQVCLDQTIAFVISLQTNQGPVAETINVNISGLGHDYEGVVTAQTCMEEGFTTYTCAACDDEYDGDRVAAKGHDYTVTSIIPMTHKSDGYSIYTCATCSDWYEDDLIPAVPYNWQIVETIAPTCTEKGYTLYEDTFWEKTRKLDWVKANGHDYVGAVTDPTCTDEGFTTYTCADCDDEYVSDKVVPKGHDHTVTSIIPMTHKSDGYSIYTCTDCDDWYENDHVSAVPYDWQFVETIAPTCTEKGYTIYEDIYWNKTRKLDWIKANGHDYRSDTTDPTCTDEGFTTYTCDTCGYEYDGDRVPANGHLYTSVVSDPTCTEEGFTTYTCTACDDSYIGDRVVANGHDYRSVVAAPTCTGGGYTIYNCSACDYEYVDDYTSENPCGDCDACNPRVSIIGVSGAKFISIAETAKNSRVWVLTFDVDVMYSNNTNGVARYSINLNGNNANLDGKYTFDADQDLAGMTLTFDIKGNGSNIKAFSIE